MFVYKSHASSLLKLSVIFVVYLAVVSADQDEVSPAPLNPSIARFLDSFVLVHTPHGYVLGRRPVKNNQRQHSTQEEIAAQLAKRQQRLQRLWPGAEKNFQLRVRKTPMAERNFQLRVRKSEVDNEARKDFLAKKRLMQMRDRSLAKNGAENNFQLRVRKTPMAERNFQLRVRKSDSNWADQYRVRKGATSAENNFQLRVRKEFPSMAERNFQLRVRKDFPSAAERNFQLRVRKEFPSMAERNFQLRVRKSYPSMAEKNFQLRVRKDGYEPEEYLEEDMENAEDLTPEDKVRLLLQRFQLMRTPEGDAILVNDENGESEEDKE